jgi:hypothetical protein
MAEKPKEVESKGSEPAIVYTTVKVKPLAELRPSDVPRGLDSDDLATDYP